MKPILSRMESTLFRQEIQIRNSSHSLSMSLCLSGAILAFMLGVFQIPLDECEEMYPRLGSDVFKQNVIVGTMKMGWNHAFYNSEIWENLLKSVCSALSNLPCFLLVLPSVPHFFLSPPAPVISCDPCPTFLAFVFVLYPVHNKMTKSFVQNRNS